MDQKTLAKYAKASAAFTSALLFGTERSEGLLKTLASSTGEACKNMMSSSTTGGQRSDCSTEGEVVMPFGADPNQPMHNPFSGHYYTSAGVRIDTWDTEDN